ncbi:terminase large subunit domain-containing protein [Desulfobacter sp. UBA2225]|jgi:hypothetical protein|uniref:terminase large subunit domain-containing protein n=1 Tax=Desulfobacter sp. UBA2225 TaxID=1961413 RepID=UPI00257FEA90|nr:terminase family protein [Desulfobacter sp. UBA2225]
MDWRPHPGAQEEFCSRGEFEVLFGGAAGPGKTDCLIMEAVRYVDFSDYKAVLFRRVFPQLQEIIDRTWKYYPLLGGEYRASEHRWYFPSGATVNLSHMQYEDNKYDHQGKEYHYVGFDEVTQFTGKQYLYLHSRVRSTNPNIPMRIRCATNPGGIGHAFFKERFIDISQPGVPYVDPETGQSRCFIPARLSDNPTLVENDPNYIKRLLVLPELERKRLMEGLWDAYEGQALPELSMRVHGVNRFEVPKDWEHFMSFDWGYAKPYSIGYHALDFDGCLWRIGSIYGTREDIDLHDVGLRETPIEIARKIYAYERDMHMPKMKFRVADPACWSKTHLKGGVLGPSVIEDMGKEGLYFLKADNNRILGRQQVHKRLKLDEDIDFVTGEVLNVSNKFYCFNDDKHFWRTMLDLRENVNNPEDVDSDQEDHIYDEFRYACMSRPIKPKMINRVPEGSFAAERNRLIKAKQYSKRHGVPLQTAYERVR